MADAKYRQIVGDPGGPGKPAMAKYHPDRAARLLAHAAAIANSIPGKYTTGDLY